MSSGKPPLRVLYSFPHKIGAGRICHTAWHQVAGLLAAGVEVQVHPGVLHRGWPQDVKVEPTLARGKFRIPYKVLGTLRACALHDWIISRRIEKLAGQIDVIHAWPLGAAETFKAAARLKIPTVLERPNAHTRFAYDAVQKECERIGVSLPVDYEHSFNAEVLRREEEEYRLADGLLCPSEFVVKTFLDEGFSPTKLVRHGYGFDDTIYSPAPGRSNRERGLTMLFVGVCAVRKGVHHALEAWLRSPACQTGSFLIAGEFLPVYAKKLSAMLAHPSVHVLGHRDDIPALMRASDIVVLPSIEEGYGLVVAEAMGSGSVPLVSDACTDICRHMQNGLRHTVGDVDTLSQQITMLDEDRALLERLREASLATVPEITWTAAGVTLSNAYREVIAAYPNRMAFDHA